MVMYANEVEKKEKKLTTTYIWSVTVQFSQTGYNVQGSYLQVFTFSELKNSHYQNEAKCQTFPVKMRLHKTKTPFSYQ